MGQHPSEIFIILSLLPASSKSQTNEPQEAENKAATTHKAPGTPFPPENPGRQRLRAKRNAPHPAPRLKTARCPRIGRLRPRPSPRVGTEASPTSPAHLRRGSPCFPPTDTTGRGAAGGIGGGAASLPPSTLVGSSFLLPARCGG